MRDILSLALDQHQAGMLQQAEASYLKILEKNPSNADALHLLGVLMHQTERSEVATQLIQSAIKFDQSNATYHFNLAEIQLATNQPSTAIKNYNKALQLDPRDGNSLFGLANAYSETGNLQQAIVNYKQAIEQLSNDPEIHNNLGNVIAETGDNESAIQSYQQALRLEPEYVEAQVNLANIYKTQNRIDEAVDYYNKALLLQPENPQIHYNRALALDQNNQQEDAIQGYQKSLSLDPTLLEAHVNLGQVLHEMQQLDGALKNYSAGLILDPQNKDSLLGLAGVQRDMGDFILAADYSQQVLAQYPDDVGAHSLLGDCLTKLDRYDEAIVQINKALKIEPDNAKAHFNLGICQQTLGQFEEALQSHRKALDLDPELTEAIYNITLIDSKLVRDDELDKLVIVSDTLDNHENSKGNSEKINLHFAMAKAYHDRERYEEAFKQLNKGNRLKSESNSFSPETYNNYIDRVIAIFDDEFFQQHASYGIDSQVPVFIIGMPRSGSTLVEQIISSHPQAYGAGELNDIRILAKQLPQILDTSDEEPECILSITKDVSTELAKTHLHKLNTLSNNAERVCDKMLGNFLKLGMIYLLFPNAKIIHCKRNPLDVGLSCYFQNFARGLRFTYELEHLGLAYRGYRKMIQHWEKVLPMNIMEVQYEDLISNQEKWSRKLIDFSGLDWDIRCMDFYQQSRGVKTASFWQVRQPLYNSSVGRWRKYDKQLKPLIDSLGNFADESYQY